MILEHPVEAIARFSVTTPPQQNNQMRSVGKKLSLPM